VQIERVLEKALGESEDKQPEPDEQCAEEQVAHDSQFSLSSKEYTRGVAVLPTVYMGQGDGTKGRIDQHLTQKVFWDRGADQAVPPGRRQRAAGAGAHRGRRPTRRGSLEEILQILPLVGLRAFDPAFAG
jgi:hypothetical protein